MRWQFLRYCQYHIWRQQSYHCQRLLNCPFQCLVEQKLNQLHHI
uniref:Uncharacterized protein n=1 Tax=Anguilla anguilla TaxID=7936 RepID=A0A0E9TM98_ANGAN